MSRQKKTEKYFRVRRFRISGLIWWTSSKILILRMGKEVPYVDKYSVLKDFWHWILMVMWQLILLNYPQPVYARPKSNHLLICYHPGTVQIHQISFLNESDFFNQNKCHFNFQNITICLRRWFLRSQTTNSIHQTWPFQPWSKQFWSRPGPNERYTLVQNLLCIIFLISEKIPNNQNKRPQIKKSQSFF